MRGGSGRPARIKSRNMKKLLFTLLFCAAAAAAAGSEPAELKLLSYNIRYIGAPGDEGDFAHQNTTCITEFCSNLFDGCLNIRVCKCLRLVSYAHILKHLWVDVKPLDRKSTRLNSSHPSSSRMPSSA